MSQVSRIVFFSFISLLNVSVVSAQPIACTTPALIGTTGDTKPRVVYNDQTGHRAIVTERLSGLKSVKFQALFDPGADDIFGTEDDTTKNLTWPHPSQSGDTGVSINQGSMLFARTTKNLGYPGLGPLPQVLSIRYLAAGPDKKFRTPDDSRERVIKAIKYNASTTITLFQTGIGDGLLAWIYAKQTGAVENVYIGGCDLTIRRGRRGSCYRKNLYERHLPANVVGGSLPTVITSPLLPVRKLVGSDYRPVALFRAGNASDQRSLVFRMDLEQIFNAELGDRTPMTWMTGNRVFTSRPNGEALVYEAGLPDTTWTFLAPLWSYVQDIYPHSDNMRLYAISDTADVATQSQAYIGSHTRREHRRFHNDRYYNRYHFVRPFGGGNAFFSELRVENKQPDNFAVGGDTVAFHMYDPGNGAYAGVGVMTCR